MPEDVKEKVNAIGREEGEQERIKLSDMFGNTTIHNIKLGLEQHRMFNDDYTNTFYSDFNFNKKSFEKEIDIYIYIYIYIE